MRKLPPFILMEGYREAMLVPAEAVVLIADDDLAADEAAPLACAGITVYNAQRNSGARSGEPVAAQAIGGRGHLGIQ